MIKKLTKEDKIKNFDPTAMAFEGRNIFGLPFTTEESEIVIIPVPWEVTVSYRKGTASAPTLVSEASDQVDLYNPLIKDFWKKGISLEPISKTLLKKNKELRVKAERHLANIVLGEKAKKNIKLEKELAEINKESEKLNLWLKNEVIKFSKLGKKVAVLGGEHGAMLGAFQAHAEINGDFGILQIDAHHDLRDSFEGFTYSHASIMHNALKIKELKKLVAVGIRDYGEGEVDVVKNSAGRVEAFYMKDMAGEMSNGATWDNLCKKIIKNLPEKVYISFDIDGLDPKNCPNTGTPVPDGLGYEQAVYLIEQLAKSGKKIIGFDLNEVGKGEWDANVGARLLYRLASFL